MSAVKSASQAITPVAAPVYQSSQFAWCKEARVLTVEVSDLSIPIRLGYLYVQSVRTGVVVLFELHATHWSRDNEEEWWEFRPVNVDPASPTGKTRVHIIND